MAQKIQPGSIFGRIGQSFGEGLAAQAPKQMEHYRKVQGLKQLEQDSGNLTPLQTQTRLASIYGLSPEEVKQFGETIRQQGFRQNLRNQYGKGRQDLQGSGIEPKGSQQIRDVQFANQNSNAPRINRAGEPSQQGEFVRPEETINQIQPKNPLRSEVLPEKPYSFEERQTELAKMADIFPNATLPELNQLVSEKEQRKLAQPAAERAIDDYREEQQTKADNAFTKSAQEKLQKNGQDIYKDITGETLANAKRTMHRELVDNPNSNVEELANKYSTYMLDLAKTKNQLKTLAGAFDAPILDKEAYRSKLAGYQDIFKKTGNLEEYWNMLKSEFRMSPQGAASIAYPRSQKIKSYIKDYKPLAFGLDPTQYGLNSQKLAVDIEKNLTSSDSLLAIARDIREKDPFFDQTAFFNQFLEDQDLIGLTPIQKREVAEGKSGILPSWGDILILPFFRGI